MHEREAKSQQLNNYDENAPRAYPKFSLKIQNNSLNAECVSQRNKNALYVNATIIFYQNADMCNHILIMKWMKSLQSASALGKKMTPTLL